MPRCGGLITHSILLLVVCCDLAVLSAGRGELSPGVRRARSVGLVSQRTRVVTKPPPKQAAKPKLAGIRPDYALFIVYSWNYLLFWTSLQTYINAGFGKDIIIIDNSEDRKLLRDKATRALVGEVIGTRTRLTFSQAQNFMAYIAIERKYTFYYWGHADVALVSSPSMKTFAKDALACVHAHQAGSPDWGILYFHYDWFSAIRVELVKKVKYDIFITVYMSDCDFYPRVRRAGYTTQNAGEVCPAKSFRAYDLKRPIDLPLHDYNKTVTILEEEEKLELDRNDWKRSSKSAVENAGWDLWDENSKEYIRRKWGTDDCAKMAAIVDKELAEKGEKGRAGRVKSHPRTKTQQ